MAKFKKTNDVSGVGRKANNYDSQQNNSINSSSKTSTTTHSTKEHDVSSRTKTDNVKTSSQIHSSAINRTQESTSSYSSNKIVDTPSSEHYEKKVELQSPYGRDSYSQPNSYVGTSSYTNSSFIASKPSIGKSRTSMSEDSLKNALGSMNYEVNRKTGTSHVQTASQSQVMAAMRTVASSNSFNSTHVSTGYKPKLNSLDSIKNGAVAALGQVSKLSASDDMGTAAVGSVATAGIVGIKSFEAAQRASDIGIKGTLAAGKGVGAVGDFSIKGAKTVGAFAQTMGVGASVTRLDGKALDILKLHAAESGLNQTEIAKGILKTAQQARTALTHGVNGVQTVIHGTLKTGKSIVVAGKVTRNVFAGTYSARQIANAVGRGIGKGAGALLYGSKKLGINGIKTAAKGIRWTFVKAFPKTMKMLGKGSIGSWRFGAKALMGSGDLGLQAVGTTMEASYQAVNVSIKTVKATAKTLQVGGKTIAYTGKGVIKTGKGLYHGAKFIKNNGLKAAWNKARQKAGKAAAQGLKNAGNAILELLKRFGTKLIVPLAIIIVLVMGFNIISAPIMAVAGVFGGIFNDDDTGEEVNIDDYLHDSSKGVPSKTTALKNDIVDKLTDAESSYDIVRFRANTSEEAGGLVIEHTYEAVSSVFPSDEEIIEMVKPLFQAVILMNYDNSPTEAQCQDLLDHIMDTMFTIVQEDTTEYCGQDVTTGEGEIDYCSSCGEIHAHDDCPNKLSVAYHSSYTCDRCCYYEDHSYYDPDLQDYVSYTTEECGGHIDCGSHSVTTFTLNCDGIYALVQEYFTDPIDDLENTSPRTDDQEQQLSQLKSYYEIFEEMAKLVGIGGYSGGLSLEDLSGVHWVNGSRTGCDGIIEFAKQYLGNIGGQPFWSNLGFESRVAWCACYVYYCMQHSGYGGSYPSSSNYAYCQTMANAFSSEGRFANSDFTDIVAGDVIYFDWECDGHTDHTGLVIGRDDTKVYTIEGNSGDKVKIKSYNLNSSVIYGYGLMNY